MTLTKRRSPTTVVRVVVALVGVGCLLLTAGGAVKAAGRGVAILHDPEYDLPPRQFQADYETLWRQFVEQVPSGSRVAITPPQTDAEHWQQRLTEFAVLNGCVVVQGADRDYSVGVVQVKRKRPTGPGVRLVVRKVG
ncbi:hypothetical protein [Micromonospora tarensis]|uniref:PASTA domain-containing protein n=1 Tax=Micromonospora tarensis TaxID=2806100 RepID=A0ABS1YDW7_9ACTN|nr:hypothetical protein [Micromonospora tarensis]MBM0275547.1 hypothetical protein [Micromonospora tarensis]